MIVASQYGWQTISDEAPTFHDLLLMAQLMSEERVGTRVRNRAGTTSAQEADRLQRLRRFQG